MPAPAAVVLQGCQDSFTGCSVAPLPALMMEKAASAAVFEKPSGLATDPRVVLHGLRNWVK
jgi:hypothetical protein